MSGIETATPITARVVADPFAALLDGPHRILPSQDEFHALQDFYEAREHPDFEHPVGYTGAWSMDVDKKHAMILPFSLALGIHPASRHGLDGEATVETFAAFAAQKPMGMSPPPSTERRIRHGRAASILSASIMNAAVHPPVPLPFRPGQIDRAIGFSREAGLLTRSQARLLSRTAGLVRPW